MRRGFVVIAGLALTAGLAGSAAAQEIGGTRAFTIGVRGGISLPMGDFGASWDEPDGLGAETGFNVSASIGFRPAMLPIGVRIEGAYDRFGFDPAGDPTFNNVDANWSVLSGTINAELGVPTTGGIQPYVIGGVGMYQTKFSASGGGGSADFDDTNVGFNVGGGLRFGLAGLSTTLEARYHTTTIDAEGESTRISFIPITFGIEF
jgi:opacity protein-like surface antigen